MRLLLMALAVASAPACARPQLPGSAAPVGGARERFWHGCTQLPEDAQCQDLFLMSDGTVRWK